MRCSRFLQIGLPCAVGLMAATAGCVDLLTAVDPGANDNTFDSGSPVGRPNDEQVLVRFANGTRSEAVDVQFFVSNSTLATLPDDLFANETNRQTASIGIAGSSLIAPGKGDQIILPCDANLTIGTQGGDFRDAESGEPRGQGEPRWVQDKGLGLCGGTVTFVYLGDGQEFQTRVTVE